MSFFAKNKKEYFNGVVDLLLIIKGKINPETDINWTTYESPEEIIVELTDSIEALKMSDYATLEKIKGYFFPTCSFQELSLTNGWGEEFLELANRFDILYEKIVAK